MTYQYKFSDCYYYYKNQFLLARLVYMLRVCIVYALNISKTVKGEDNYLRLKSR